MKNCGDLFICWALFGGDKFATLGDWEAFLGDFLTCFFCWILPFNRLSTVAVLFFSDNTGLICTTGFCGFSTAFLKIVYVYIRYQYLFKL